MTLLVHVDYRGSLAFPAVAVDSSNISSHRRVVHAEVTADVHATVGGDMVFEIAVWNQNAAKHGGGRIIIRLLVIACAFIGDATTNGHLGRILEVPHDLLRGGGVGGLLICRGSLRVTVTNLEAIPPETPASMEVNVATDIDYDRGIIRNIGEHEVNATIAARGKLICGDVEDLHGRAFASGIRITSECNELFSI